MNFIKDFKLWVSWWKRYSSQDMLSAYQSGAIENASKDSLILWSGINGAELLHDKSVDYVSGIK